MEVGGQRHDPAALSPRKTRYPLYRRLGRPQGRSERVRKISPSPGFDPWTVQSIAIRCTDWAIPDFDGVLNPTVSPDSGSGCGGNGEASHAERNWIKTIPTRVFIKHCLCRNANIPSLLKDSKKKKKNDPSPASGYSVQTMRRLEITCRKQDTTVPQSKQYTMKATKQSSRHS
jgi:hypothetical protein